MRTVTYTFGGETVDGDLILVSARSSRGGQNTAKCVVGDPTTPDLGPHYAENGIRRNFRKALDFDGVTKVLAEQINSQIGEFNTGDGDFKAHAKGKMLVLMASNMLNDVSFHYDFEGSMKETCEIEVLG